MKRTLEHTRYLRYAESLRKYQSYLLWCNGAFDALLELSWSVSVSSKLDVFLSLLVFFYSTSGKDMNLKISTMASVQ